MSEIWRPLTREVYLNWIDVIRLNPKEELTAWETRFVDDIFRRLTSYTNYTLSEKQHEILEQIYAEKT